ncbi:riboflavin synthase [uncultured Fretibacterium sp.]|uniref:riboflavin synthase n=1 Tax=uncultured Fretibacterium sp. TaxID=1678694 RepID=UPI0026333AE9|nr:riboflavin synthase [uncultured Fretibacterium sp.]
MFTGLVEAVGAVRAFRRAEEVSLLSIECPALASELVLGQSVAVSGACLSVVALHGDVFDVEMMPETAERTWFADLRPGTLVNLERAMALGDRLDGHLVLGHVDGTAVLKRLSGTGRTRVACFGAGPPLLRGIVPKGSVAIDGVSLTVIGVSASDFSVGLIPTTLESCTLGRMAVGTVVNLETDILGKYVERLLGSRGSGMRLSMEELRDLGY